jgi:hypothetical protein
MFQTINEVVVGCAIGCIPLLVWREHHQQVKKILPYFSLLPTIAAYLMGPLSRFRGSTHWIEDVGYAGNAFLVSLFAFCASCIWCLRFRKAPAFLALTVSGWLTFLWLLSVGITD